MPPLGADPHPPCIHLSVGPPPLAAAFPFRVLPSPTPSPPRSRPQTVPANASRLGLSQVINSLLSLSPPLPFEFLVGGELLRGSLGEALEASGASLEQTVDVEYVRAVLPPSERPPARQEDWTAALATVPLGWRDAWEVPAAAAAAAIGDGDGDAATPFGAVLSASFDGRARLWLSPSAAPAAPSVPAPLRAATASASEPLVFFGGDEGAVDVWKVGEAEQTAAELVDPAARLALTRLARFVGPSDGVTALQLLEGADATPGKHPKAAAGAALLAAAGADGGVAVYLAPRGSFEHALGDGTPVGSLPGDPTPGRAGKKRKGAKAAETQSELFAVPRLAPAFSFLAHRGAATALAAPCPAAAPALLASAGEDGAVRLWDLHSALGEGRAATDAAAPFVALGAAATRAPALALASVGGPAAQTLASGGADGVVAVWDFRTESGKPVSSLLGRGGAAASSSAPAKPLVAFERQPRVRSAHGGWITALAAHPTSPYHFASASHDGTARIWDLRAAAPLFTLRAAQGERLQAVAWAGESTIAYAGASQEVYFAQVEGF